MSKCANCGNERPPGHQTCPNCGAERGGHTNGHVNPFPAWELAVFILFGLPTAFLSGCGLYMVIGVQIDPSSDDSGLASFFGGASFIVGALIFVPLLIWFLRRWKG